VLQDCGAQNAQAVQLSGAAGNTILNHEFDSAIAFEDAGTAGACMVFGPDRDLLDMVRNFVHFFAHESCGFCTPCRVGGVLLKKLVDKVYRGEAGELDLQEMQDLGELMRNTSHCGLGSTAPNPVLDTLAKCPAIYRQRLRSSAYAPAFDLDAELEQARQITGRHDRGAHIKAEP